MNVEFALSNFINYSDNMPIKKESTIYGKDIKIPEGTNIKDIFKTFKIENFDSVINFLNINNFVFDINNVYKIDFIDSISINFQFKGLFSEKNVLQYDIKNNKFKLIINGYICALDPKKLNINSFNSLCINLSSNKKMIDSFFLNQDEQLKLTDLNKFLDENNILYDSITKEHIILSKIVGY